MKFGQLHELKNMLYCGKNRGNFVKKIFRLKLLSEVWDSTKTILFVLQQIKSSVNVAKTTFNKKSNPTDHAVNETHGQ